jgi:hypothetical protein
MAVNVKLKRSAVPGKIPLTSSVELGELALNTYDGYIYLKRDGINGQEIVRISGSLASNTSILTGTTANQVISSFRVGEYRSVKYLVTASHATLGYHTSELLLIHDGTTVHITEYASLWTTASLGLFNASISAGVVNLTFSPVNTNTTVSVQQIAASAV